MEVLKYGIVLCFSVGLPFTLSMSVSFLLFGFGMKPISIILFCYIVLYRHFTRWTIGDTIQLTRTFPFERWGIYQIHSKEPLKHPECKERIKQFTSQNLAEVYKSLKPGRYKTLTHRDIKTILEKELEVKARPIGSFDKSFILTNLVNAQCPCDTKEKCGMTRMGKGQFEYFYLSFEIE